MSQHKPGRDATIGALSSVAKDGPRDIDPGEFVKILKDESDRGAISLAATMIEDRLELVLSQKMPDINSDERARIFSVDGLAGTFSRRIQLAHALGIIDRRMRADIDLIRNVRNACAHAVGS